jgi:hypothetical protein
VATTTCAPAPAPLRSLADQSGHRARRRRVAEQGAEVRPSVVEQVDVTDDEVDAQRLGPGPQHGEGLRVGVVVHEEAVARALLLRRAIVIASAAAVASSSSEAFAMSSPVSSAHHRLEVQQRLEPTLADLGLVRRVRGVPGGVLEHVAPDHRWRDGAGVAHADQAGHQPVPRPPPLRRATGLSPSVGHVGFGTNPT